MKALTIAWFLIIILALVGWFKDVIHLVHCDFKSPYKAEVIYGVGAVTGAGAIIGWINIPDGNQ